jgi:hypothetical protein
MRVKWEIDIDAATPQEAAQKALEIQRDPDSIATVFEVDGVHVDLGEPITILPELVKELEAAISHVETEDPGEGEWTDCETAFENGRGQGEFELAQSIRKILKRVRR